MITVMEMKLVDAEKVHKLRVRAIRFRKSILTYFIGTLIKQILEELELWEDDDGQTG